MDGTNSQRLIQATNSTPIRWPDGLAVDYNSESVTSMQYIAIFTAVKKKSFLLVWLKVKDMQRPGAEAIRTQIQPSKSKRKIT